MSSRRRARASGCGSPSDGDWTRPGWPAIRLLCRLPRRLIAFAGRCVTSFIVNLAVGRICCVGGRYACRPLRPPRSLLSRGLAYQAGWFSSGSAGPKHDSPGRQYVTGEDPLTLFVEASNRVWAADSVTAAIGTDLDSLEDGLSRTRTASDGMQDTLDDIDDRIDDLFDSGPVDTLSWLETIRAGAVDETDREIEVGFADNSNQQSAVSGQQDEEAVSSLGALCDRVGCVGGGCFRGLSDGRNRDSSCRRRSSGGEARRGRQIGRHRQEGRSPAAGGLAGTRRSAGSSWG